ncbi:MAG: stage II sporulation protein M [Ruminococcus sp.]|nr:stage II sporulation protein M [Ruminococcus sp.]
MKRFHSRKEMFAFFMPGFLLGILYINFAVKQYFAEPGIFSSYFLKQYASADIIVEEYTIYLLRIRIVPFALLTGLAFTKVRKIAAIAFLFWTGFSSGMLLTMAVAGMGVKGIILCVAGIVPHFLCYIPSYIVVLWYCWTYPANRWNKQKTVFAALMMLLGLVLEVYVNPVLMKGLLGTL